MEAAFAAWAEELKADQSQFDADLVVWLGVTISILNRTAYCLRLLEIWESRSLGRSFPFLLVYGSVVVVVVVVVVIVVVVVVVIVVVVVVVVVLVVVVVVVVVVVNCCCCCWLLLLLLLLVCCCYVVVMLLLLLLVVVAVVVAAHFESLSLFELNYLLIAALLLFTASYLVRNLTHFHQGLKKKVPKHEPNWWSNWRLVPFGFSLDFLGLLLLPLSPIEDVTLKLNFLNLFHTVPARSATIAPGPLSPASSRRISWCFLAATWKVESMQSQP